MPLTLDPEVFLDSAYLIALANPADEFHASARHLANEIRKTKVRVTTTRGVLLEVASLLSKIRYRAAAVQLIEALAASPSISVFTLSDELCGAGWQIYKEHRDKEWSWVDCISFVVMRERALRQALTTDEHFRQAGFTPLLRVS